MLRNTDQQNRGEYEVCLAIRMHTVGQEDDVRNPISGSCEARMHFAPKDGLPRASTSAACMCLSAVAL